MRTNIVLDDNLVEKAFKYTPVETKRELVEQALREFVEGHERRNLLDLVGQVQIDPDYNYKKMREHSGSSNGSQL